MHIDDIEYIVNLARDGDPVSLAAVIEHGVHNDNGMDELYVFGALELGDFKKFWAELQSINDRDIEDTQDRVAFNAIMSRLKNSGEKRVTEVSMNDNSTLSL